MKTVHEVSRISGVSVRTLHYYDEIGLLAPSAVTSAGYRLYDDAALERLQSILLFRELRFSLREIGAILDHPDFDRRAALEQQIRLLQLQEEHIRGLIRLARETLQTGVNTMDFSAFDKSRLEEYAAEAKRAWGNTEAYGEYMKKTEKKTQKETEREAEEMTELFAALGAMRELPPDAPEVQAAVKKLQQYITAHYYRCTPQILFSLGQMYVSDDRFRENIDRAGGSGTAEFTARAIEIYCGR
ncbi:MAG: MerR family transcriptional regulator [Eubacteriales bacterium]